MLKILIVDVLPCYFYASKVPQISNTTRGLKQEKYCLEFFTHRMWERKTKTMKSEW